ncbi:MAG TPA: DUF1987 domain-containing protein [Bacteroidia bacterium]|nr:DUF1987 domain-containing protein [Bacteroidia bacterium]
MDVLFAAATKSTPELACDPVKGSISIKGRSIPADASVFYDRMDKWVEKLCEEPGGRTVTFSVMVDHLNTGSVRSILTMMSRLKKAEAKGLKLVIDWNYEMDDEDIRDKGEEMSMIVGHPFNYIPFRYEG